MSWIDFLKDLWSEVQDDQVTTGAAALSYYLLLALFPAMIFLLSLLPYLPIPALERALSDMIVQTLPPAASTLLTGTLRGILAAREGGLLSFGALFTLWAASQGMAAIIQELNFTYDVHETRPIWKTRGIAVLLTVVFGVLVIASFALIVLGGQVQALLGRKLGFGPSLLALFAVVRWVIIALALALAFAVTYYWGPDVVQEFRFITPGSVFGVLVLASASVGFRAYVSRFGNYNATYGSLGAVIILMLWLYITGLVLLLGSEINALIEHYSPEGKRKGQREPFHRQRLRQAA